MTMYMLLLQILLRAGIDVCNRRIAMRPYTDVLQDEFEEYKEYIALQKKYVYNKIRTLDDETIPKDVSPSCTYASLSIISDDVIVSRSHF